MIRFKVEKREVPVHEVTHERIPVEFPLAEMKRKQSFVVPIQYAQVVRNRVQSVKREKPNRQFITRTTPDKLNLRVWRTA